MELNYNIIVLLIVTLQQLLNLHTRVMRVPFKPFVGPNFILMLDNAWPHITEAVQAYLREICLYAKSLSHPRYMT